MNVQMRLKSQKGGSLTSVGEIVLGAGGGREE